MIRLHNLSKTYRLEGRKTVVAKDICATFPAYHSVGLLGRNGAGKSSLLRMIAGTMDADAGWVETSGSVSWPVGFSGSFHGDLSGAQNVRFIARIYGIDTLELISATQDFAELGKHMHLPVKSYSSGMKSRLAFGVSMAIPFQTYLVDEVTSVGDAAFREKSKRIFIDRMTNAGAIIVSHSLPLIREVCDHAAVLEDGSLTYYHDVEAAIEHHLSLVHIRAA